jgi:branched-chain amino acid transport system substrate-binding protein
MHDKGTPYFSASVGIRLSVPYLMGCSAAALVLIFSACGSDESDTQKDGYAVGLLLPFTGEDASYGTNFERAAVMAKDAVNEAGGIDGKPIYFVTKDTHSDVTRAGKMLDEILREDVVAVIGPEGAQIAREALPILEDKRVMLISPLVSGASSIEVNPDFPWFRLAPSPSIMGRAFANHLLSEEGIDVISLAGTDEDYNLDFVDSFRSRFEQLGGQVDVSVTLDPSKLSFREEVQALRMGETRNILLSASTDVGARLVNDLTISDETDIVHWQWYLSPVLETPVFIQNTVYAALEGALGIGIKVYDPAEEFIASYQDRWSDSPGDGSFYYYDAVVLLALAMEKALNDQGNLKYESIRDGFEQITTPAGILVKWNQMEEGFTHITDNKTIHYSGLTGTLLFDELGQQQRAPMAMWSIQDGQIEIGEDL